MQTRPTAIVWLRHNRHTARNVVIAVTLAVGGVVLLRQARMLGLALASLSHASPFGLVLTGVFGASTYLAAAVAITAASGLPLPLWRTAAAQLAAACTNRLTPAGLGGMATNARYLEGSGATRSQAVTAIGLTSVASFAVHSFATFAALAVARPPAGARFSMVPLALPGPVVVAGAVVAAAVGIVMAQRFGTRARAAARGSWGTVRSMGADGRRLTHLLVGTVGVTLGHGLAFAAAVTACGVHLSIIGLLSVFLAGSAVASVAPTPGGLGALEAALVTGLTAFGAHIAPALAGAVQRIVSARGAASGRCSGRPDRMDRPRPPGGPELPHGYAVRRPNS